MFEVVDIQYGKDNIIPQDYPSANQLDINDAKELGQSLRNAGIDLSNVDYCDISPVIIQSRNNEDLNGYGASNSEIESFWNGYEGKPLKQGCFTEFDMNNAVETIKDDMLNPFKYDVRTVPTVIEFNEEDPCCMCNDEECLDDNIMAQIDAIINAGKM